MMSDVSLSTLFRESLRIGLLGFGGPVGQIALMHRRFVDERGWIDDARFQRMLAFCMLLPGPEAQQLATYIGWRLRGAVGGLIAGWLFVLPGAVIVLALTYLYLSFGDLPLVMAAFDGVKCAVVALVVEALMKFGKRGLKARGAFTIATGAFVALMFGVAFPVVILAAGIFGAVFPPPPAGEVRAQRGEGGVQSSAPLGQSAARPDSSPVHGGARAAAVWLLMWLAPLALIAATLGTSHVLFQIALLFSVLACVTFGGAYAVLAYLSVEAVARGWLSATQMIDGLGLAETTPGPLILVNEFVGFLAGWSAGSDGLAIAGALLAVWCTFAPSFVWIFAGAPLAERLEHNRIAAGVLAAISAAVIGVIANLAMFFTAHALFEAQVQLGFVEAPDVSQPRWWAIALALMAGVALIRFKTPVLVVIAACAFGGLAAGAMGLL